MSDLNILLEWRRLFYLDRAKANRTRNLERARFWLDKALDIDCGSDRFLWALAADGFLKIKENRLSEARTVFDQCWELSRHGNSDNDQYICAYSEFFLAVGDQSAGYQRIKDLGIRTHSARNNASAFLRLLLPLTSLDTLHAICGNRKADVRSLCLPRRDPRDASVDINFDL